MAADSDSASLYPIALDLRGSRCVVVGAGAVAVRKSEGLVAAGAKVVVVAPVASDNMRDLIDTDAVIYLEEPFMPTHLDNVTLAIAATNRSDVNRAVFVAGLERNILVNIAGSAIRDISDDRRHGDFVTMATVRRGDLLLAVTTGGAGPALSARLKRELERSFGPEWEPYVALLHEIRTEAKAWILDETERAAALRRLAADDSIRTLLASGDYQAARRKAFECLS